ncbi:hypothetical protein G6011_05790 [Alternaria panax]|uniref:Alpha/beta hydrolase fold-3 domain-containing protein n=1 Tax=Alternaria panax TaxID=48097 RepID=A0AAD4I957_9PLEO|nr:hypothetical protein G6011_05790 [Alternaria panax]
MAKKVKKGAKAASVALPRPVIRQDRLLPFEQAQPCKADYLSPYTSPSVTLHFGATHQIYYLPEVLLQRLENIPSRDPWTREIYLVDVDASIGHVLIHYLHTGVYQTLNSKDVEDIDDTHKTFVRNEFQTAVLALEAAKKYSVPGLQELAQIELDRRGKDMCLRGAVYAIREEFISGLPDERAWLQNYVSEKVRWTFEHDPSMLSDADFFGSIESPTMTRLLAQIIVGLYSKEVDKLRKEKTANGRISTPEHDQAGGSCLPDLPDMPYKRIAVSCNAWPASVEKFGAFDDPSAAWDPHNLDQDSSSRPETGTPTASCSCDRGKTKEEMLHTVEAHAEAGTNNLEHSQLERLVSSIDQALEHDATDVEGLNQSKEERTASSSKLDEDLKPSKEVDTKRQKEEVEHIRLEEKEARSNNREEEEVAPTATEAEECKKKEVDVWGDWSDLGRLAASTVIKKKKGKKAKRIYFEEEDAEHIRLEAEETERKNLEEEEGKRLEEEEEQLRLQEKEVAAAAAESEEAQFKRREEEEAASKLVGWGKGIWGGGRKKNKETTRERRLREKKEQEERLVAAAAEAGITLISDSTTEKSATSDDDACELRLEHLSRDGGWQGFMENLPVRPPFDVSYKYASGTPSTDQSLDLEATRKTMLAMNIDDKFIAQQQPEYKHITFTAPGVSGLSDHPVTISGYQSTRGTRRTWPAGRPVVYYVHGGGQISGDRFIGLAEAMAHFSPADDVFFASPEYRLAPEYPAPAGVYDVYAGLTYLVSHAKEFGIDPAKIVLFGISGGAGITASTCLLARQLGGHKVAALLLNIPMLDDRHEK